MLLPAWRAERLPSATEREKKEGNERAGVGVHAGEWWGGTTDGRGAQRSPHRILVGRSVELAYDSCVVHENYELINVI